MTTLQFYIVMSILISRLSSAYKFSNGICKFSRFFSKQIAYTMRKSTRLESQQKSINDSRSSTRGPSKKFQPFPFQYHEEITIKIDSLTNMGLGVGRKTLNDGSNWVIHVPYTFPGEEVKCRVYTNFATYSEADLVEIITKSPDRIEPVCQYYGTCGGCQYQHVTVEAQRRWKQEQVEQLLSRIAGFSISQNPLDSASESIHVNPVVGTNDTIGYRAKLTPHYDTPREKDFFKVGFQVRGTNRIIDIDECIIGTPKINIVYKETRRQLKDMFFPTNSTTTTSNTDSNHNDTSTVVEAPATIDTSRKSKKAKRGATLLLREVDEGVVTDPRQYVTQTVESVKFRFLAGEFFQNNMYVLPLMVRHVLHHARLDGCQYLIDTYCGSGLFALCGAQYFDKVYGVEVSQKAIEAAKYSATENNIKNTKFLAGESENIFGLVNQEISKDNREKTVVVIDPPRAGCTEEFLEQLFRFSPKKLVYVSCDPSTQARDAKMIVDAGYRVIDVTPFDLFPQTRHIENVMVFIR